MSAIVKARFDGKQFLPEEAPGLEAGRTYLLHVEEVQSETRRGKIATLRQAMEDEAFLNDIREVATDFSGVDFEA
jgi:hypothetical protein